MDLKAVLAFLDGEGTNEEKADKILALHKSGVEGLEKAKEKILAEKKAEQERHAKLAGEIEAEREASKAEILELQDQVKKASPEEAQKAFEVQLERKAREFEAREKKLAEELNESKASHSSLLERRRLDIVGLNLENAMTKLGITDPDDRENCRDKFMLTHGASFSPGANDEIPVNAEYKTVSEVLEGLASTATAFQKFVPAKNNGGGASGGSHGGPTGKNVMSREKFDAMTPQERMSFTSKGGKIG